MALSNKDKRELEQGLGNDRLAKKLGDDLDAIEAGTGLDDGAVSTAKIADTAVTTAKIADLNVTSAKLGADAVSGADKIADDAVSLEHLDSGIAPILIAIAAEDADTMSREENVAGLSSAITLANSMKTVLNAHAADATDHTTAIDNVNFPIATADATDLASLLTLVGDELTAYDAHDADAELGAAWVFHAAQETGDHSLVTAAAPTTLEEAVTRLNDLKAKYNAHDADASAHGVGSQHQESTADAAYGAANLVSVANVQSGDIVSWSILDSGTGTVTGVSAVAGSGSITFTFSADPQNDAIISYCVFRAAA